MENETYIKRLKDRLQIEFKKQDTYAKTTAVTKDQRCPASK